MLREARIEDLKRVIQLQKIWEAEEITYGFVADTEENLEKKLGKYFLVYEIDNAVEGFVYGSIHKAENMAIMKNGEKYIEIEDIFLTKKARGN